VNTDQWSYQAVLVVKYFICQKLPWQGTWYLLIYLDQETVKEPFPSSRQAATCCYLENRNMEAVEYFLLPLPASYKVSRFRVCFRFKLLSSKCIRFHKNLTASTSLPHVLWKMLWLLTHQKVKCFRVCFRFQLLSSKCFRFNNLAVKSLNPFGPCLNVKGDSSMVFLYTMMFIW